MKHSDFKIGMRFTCSRDAEGLSQRQHLWQVTDIGSRVIIAIPVREGWMDGPPYTLVETVFDEEQMIACEV